MVFDEQKPVRRAGQRDDELLPGQSSDQPAGGSNAAGTAGGGLAGGGLAGTNEGDGSYDDTYHEDAMSAGIHDHNGDKVDEQQPESGPAGGATGGTPADKRSGPPLLPRTIRGSKSKRGCSGNSSSTR